MNLKALLAPFRNFIFFVSLLVIAEMLYLFLSYQPTTDLYIALLINCLYHFYLFISLISFSLSLSVSLFLSLSLSLSLSLPLPLSLSPLSLLLSTSLSLSLSLSPSAINILVKLHFLQRGCMLYAFYHLMIL